ncbi:hypothetical protein SAMN05421823_112105 [Catalinimonas alkaloidigena]|uniref:NACHT domain-containing protein n=1 Tax=Catalinimonas alkaloidigena TaxID=1075417 RepID=A0A1G9SBP6_9BACT|nr:hypothetical protein [Catalinimonas alkaloidigena]SDM32916.1 hypothetical protein SAMN05421823_112105 [Catalinimonas alkaloidigena]
MNPTEISSLLKEICESLNCPIWLTGNLYWFLIVGLLCGSLKVSWSVVQKIALWRNRKILNRDLHPYYTPGDVDNATRYFIATKYQKVSPSEDEEPGRKHIASAKEKLIPLFLKKAFQSKEDAKYYLILADTGMGKSTFLINLYLAYKNQWHSPLAVPKFRIKLLPLGQPEIVKRISEISDKEHTILLLDAFDEDVEAIKDYRARLNELLAHANPFRIIVLTCRTQFFPSQKEEPHETGYFSAGEHGEYKFQKLYISIFDNKDITKYLHKRFNVLHVKERKLAKKIVIQSSTLLVRPMLLSHIKELVVSEQSYEFSFQVYAELIERWLVRESRKPGIRQKYGSESRFKEILHDFSLKLATNLYSNRDERGGYFISNDEPFQEDVLSLSDIESEYISLTEQVGKTQSLLNRNAAGEYKFAHKSILEFFLAKKFAKDQEFALEFNFTGMDTALRFCKEMLLEDLRNTDGEYTGATSHKLNKLSQLDLPQLDSVSTIQINTFSSINLARLRVIPKLHQITILNKSTPILYHLYYSLYLHVPQDLQSLHDSFKMKELREHIDLRDLRHFLESLGMKELRKRLEFQTPQQLQVIKELVESLDPQEITDIEQSRAVIHESLIRRDGEVIEQLQIANEFVRELCLLETRLPNHVIYY